MRILIATGVYPPDIGGPATYSKLLHDELPKRGYEIKILSFGEVRNLPKIIRHIVYFFKVLKKSRGCKAIFSQDPVSAGLPSMIAAKIARKKFLLRVAGDYAWEQAVQRFGVKDSIDDFQNKKYGFSVEFLRKIQKFVANHSDRVITPSVYFKKLVERWLKNYEKVTVVYNGIKLADEKSDKRQCREELGIGRDSKIIISAGRMVPWKGFKTLIEVTGELESKTPNLFLVILGDGPDRKELETEAEKMRVKDRVIFTGSVPRDVMFKYLYAADIFVLNTSFESFSFQVVEAMNCGLPVVTTKVGNLEEIIDDKVNGLLVPYNDKMELGRAISLLFSDNSLRDRISKEAEIKSKNFSIENTMQNLIRVLESI